MRFLPLVVVLVVTSTALGDDRVLRPPETLHGHERVAVNVIIAENEYGIQPATFKAFLLSSLQDAGVPATDKTETALGWLHVTLSILPTDGVTVFVLDVTLEQPVKLIVGEGVCIATTWEHSHYGILPEGGGPIVRVALEKAVAKFSKDWASSHKAAATDPFEGDGE